MQYCPHCMRPTPGSPCSHCGGQVNWVAPPTQLPMGTLLRSGSGRMYQVGAAKGQGGFGITYAAMDLSGNFRVAIKEYYPTRWANRDRLSQVIPATGQNQAYLGGKHSFLEEAKMLSSVGALPSVVSVRDYFEANGTAYLVMEYVEGQPLHQVVQNRGGRMSRQELLPLLPDLMRDLGILHRAGVIHRDISPDNLILTTDGKLKLLDFGSARTMQEGKDMTVMLKAGFSPLEQYQSKGQGPCTDIYALAATIYYCLTGQVPPASVDRITADSLVPLRNMGVDLTPREDQAILWAMRLNAQQRPQSVEDFARMLLETGPQTGGGSQGSQTGGTQGGFQTGGTQGGIQTGPQTGGSSTNTGKGKKGLLMGLIAGGAAVLVAVVAILCLTLFGTKTQGDYKYKVRSGEAWIVDYRGTSSAPVIPDTLGKYPVRGIASGAFEDNNTLTNLTLPGSLDTVEPGAIYDCDRLVTIIVQGKNTQMEIGSIADCDALRCIVADSEKQADRLERDTDLEDVAYCAWGQPLLSGELMEVQVSNGVPYGINQRGEAQALLLPDGVRRDDLPSSLGSCRVFDPNGERVGAIIGTTDDGYEYEIVDGQVIIVGYSGSGIAFMPDEVEGLPVTIIASSAFAGNSDIISLFLPTQCKEIQSGALSGCTGLRDLYVYSDVTVPTDLFTDCKSLRGVLTRSNLAKSWPLPAQCKVYEMGMETPVGELNILDVDENGVIYGVTMDDQALLLHVPAGITELECPTEVLGAPVSYVHANALKDVSGSIYIVMAPNMYFPYDLWDDADWENYSFGDLSHSWVMTCLLCDMIVEAGGDPIVPDILLIQASMTRAEELSRKFDHVRPNGGKWKDLLNELGVNWSTGTSYKDSVATWDEDAYSEGFDVMLEDIAASFANGTSEGEAYEGFGMAMYYHESGSTVYCQCFGVVRE